MQRLERPECQTEVQELEVRWTAQTGLQGPECRDFSAGTGVQRLECKDWAA